MLRHLGALTAIRLRLAEELGHFLVSVTLRVLDVGFQPQRVVEALLGVPNEVVVLVLGARNGSGFGGHPLSPSRYLSDDRAATRPLRAQNVRRGVGMARAAPP